MKGKFQWKAEIHINASQKRVWEIIDDISLIPKYHPDVAKVILISGQKNRAVGVKYQCNILEGRKGNCIEKVCEYIPNVKVSTFMSEDSWGMHKMLADFVLETTLLPQDNNSTILLFEAFYNPVGFFNKLLNVLWLRRVIKKRSLIVMTGIKRLSENTSIANTYT
ncbi:SRPBCC family protein [Paenibacillus sp. KQZ6P-2]|uniref:SRPBCC family protein n=1 Tax=Paenibacillus mangrovi TaxID=2931978 RepID=A0A9X1WUT2_9BACL|nr:SRPBCC family protein [Paenibacillus mangrovi]MCJ8012274.1 SRPBCC family protein [Paenibacillus mangrovi]